MGGLMEKKAYVAMVLVQVIYAGTSMVSKAAFDNGMNTSVFVFYRQATATIVLLPIALIFGRKTAPPLPFKLFLKMFSLALYGYAITINLHNMAINYTSATVAAAASNLSPVFTIVLAILLRMESVKPKSASGIMKIIGVVFCLTGVTVIAFYKGPRIKSFNHHHHPILHGSSSTTKSHHSNESWIIGSFLMILVAFGWASWMVMQGILLREYPSRLWSATLTCLFSSVQTFLVAIAFERRMYKWKLHPDVGLLAVTSSGVLISGLVLYVQTWCIDKKGPVFVAMFTPLSFVVTLASSSSILGEVINLGSVLGGTFLIGGLYSVLWGKSKEERAEKKEKTKDEMQMQGLESGPSICNDELSIL